MNLKPTFQLLIVFILLSSCQQRYAHIPKVKAQPKPIANAVLEVEPISHLSSPIELTVEPLKAQAIQPELYTVHDTSLDPANALDSSKSQSLEIDEDEEPESLRYRDLNRSDQLGVLGISSLGLLTVSSAWLVAYTYFLESFFNTFALVSAANTLLPTLLIIGLIALSILFITHLFIKWYLGERLNIGDISILLLLLGLVLLVSLIISFWGPYLVLSVFSILGLISILHGSKHKKNSKF
ncbi:MAG: hypothetical protein EP332_07180 [Bacteroidetes bacterium]|nr:MAG: hypothetical protein EP332_07180 [Bacteroidota bacterium]